MVKLYRVLLKRTVPAEGDKPPRLRYTVFKMPVPKPEADQVVVRMGGAPINPSDLGGMYFGSDKLDEAVNWTDKSGRLFVDIPLPEGTDVGEQEGEWGGMGNEGAGVVEDAGEHAKHLLGKTVFVQGFTYTEVQCRKMDEVQEQPEGVTPKQAASSFVNPMTVLGMVEKMRREHHIGMVHTAAASQLGRMLVRVCVQEKIPLVNIVRRPEHVEGLKALGATHVVDSSAASFREDLIRALAETGATLAYDAVGGGNVASVILECMETAAWFRGDKGGAGYGSSAWKTVYHYGRLDPSPAEFSLNYGGFRYIIGGYLLPDFLETITPEWYVAAKDRIARELDTTFRTDYLKEVTLEDMLDPANMKLANAKGTAQKLLIVP